jgi:hypothetical protein
MMEESSGGSSSRSSSRRVRKSKDRRSIGEEIKGFSGLHVLEVFDDITSRKLKSK